MLRSVIADADKLPSFFSGALLRSSYVAIEECFRVGSIDLDASFIIPCDMMCKLVQREGSLV
jgi:hypothetical protein